MGVSATRGEGRSYHETAVGEYEAVQLEEERPFRHDRSTQVDSRGKVRLLTSGCCVIPH